MTITEAFPLAEKLDLKELPCSDWLALAFLNWIASLGRHWIAAQSS
jgi:hypothetical protein